MSGNSIEIGEGYKRPQKAGDVFKFALGSRLQLPDIVYFSVDGVKPEVRNYLSMLPENIRRGNVGSSDKINLYVQTSLSTGARIGCKRLEARSVAAYAKEISRMAFDLHNKENLLDPLAISGKLEEKLKEYKLL